MRAAGVEDEEIDRKPANRGIWEELGDAAGFEPNREEILGAGL